MQYLPPLLEEAHSPHKQLEAEEEEDMIGGMCMLVVRVECAGSVCTVRPCCFVRLVQISAPKIWQTTAYWGSPRSSIQDHINLGESVGFIEILINLDFLWWCFA